MGTDGEARSAFEQNFLYSKKASFNRTTATSIERRFSRARCEGARYSATNFFLVLPGLGARSQCVQRRPAFGIRRTQSLHVVVVHHVLVTCARHVSFRSNDVVVKVCGQSIERSKRCLNCLTLVWTCSGESCPYFYEYIPSVALSIYRKTEQNA